jgi:phosphinothricin acetyltransferase
MAVIALPNPVSVGLHEKLGFVRRGLFTEVGRKFGHWIDVGFWEKTVD